MLIFEFIRCGVFFCFYVIDVCRPPNQRRQIMAEEEREHQDGASDTESVADTDIDESGDGAGETQVVAQETEVVPDEDADARMMEGEHENPVDSREAQEAEARGTVESDGGVRAGDEPTQATQIDSPQAPTQHDEDPENTESLNPSPPPSPSRHAAGGTAARRTHSPLRRNGRGSGFQLSRDGAAGAGAADVDGTTSSGFLSSAEPSAKAARAPAASSLSPHPLPAGWLDDPPNADRAAATEGAQTQARPKQGAQPAGNRASTTAAAADERASVPETLPKKPSPAKAATDSAGWIRTKSSPSKGKGRRAPPVSAAGAEAAGDEEDEEHATAPDTQEGSVSQSFLAIGVPHERRVLEPPRSRPTAAGGAAATTAGADQGQDEDEEDEEENEMLAAAATGGTVNSQELRADELSQMKRECSQDNHSFNRMMDGYITGAMAEIGGPDPLTGAPDEGSPPQTEPRSQGGDDGGSGDSGGGGKRKKMKASGTVAAADGGGVDGVGSAKTPRGGAAGRKGTGGSRTPGAYVVGLGAKSSSKKRAAPR